MKSWVGGQAIANINAPANLKLTCSQLTRALKTDTTGKAAIPCPAVSASYKKDNAKFETQIVNVVKALRADTAAREKPPAPRL